MSLSNPDEGLQKLEKPLTLTKSLKYCCTEKNKIIYSGGQQRRASFIVALLHEPSILILDEPTVGVDPVLRARYNILFIQTIHLCACYIFSVKLTKTLQKQYKDNIMVHLRAL